MGTSERIARIPGVLVPLHGTFQLSANAAGVITDQLIEEGEQVTAGQPLFVLGTDSATAEGSTAVLMQVHMAQRRITLDSERTAHK
jgi:membrane fusion protein